MNDEEIAAYMRDKLRRRLSGPDIELVSVIADGLPIAGTEKHRFEHLKTQFAAELAGAGKEATAS